MYICSPTTQVYMFKQYDNNEVLIDGSYFIYSTYFNSNYLYKKEFPNFKVTDNYDWSKNGDFVRIFAANVKRNLRKIKRKFNIPFNKIYFIRDCLRETIWRLNIYDKYKADRKSFVKHQNVQLDLGNLFINIYNNILPDIANSFGIPIIKIDHAEADDVIFLFSKIMVNNGKNVNIISNDSDFYQILSENVKMFEVSMEEVVIEEKDELNVLKTSDYMKNLLLFKVLRGDRSDNVKGFRVSKRNFNMEYIMNIMDQDDNIKTFVRNRKLIDCNYIPYDLKLEIIQKYKDLN